MPRLLRPHIPLETRCRVALRQLGEFWTDQLVREAHAVYRGQGGLRTMLDELLARLATLLGCEVKDLRLDHDPPLAARPQHRSGLGPTRYTPDANDPEHLAYRPHGTQFAGSHDVKTRIRGDNGQYSDIALIKRARRRERPHKSKKKWRSRPFSKAKRKIESRRGFR